MDVLGIFRNVYIPLLLLMCDVLLVPYFVARVAGYYYYQYGQAENENGVFFYGPGSVANVSGSLLSSDESIKYHTIGMCIHYSTLF